MSAAEAKRHRQEIWIVLVLIRMCLAMMSSEDFMSLAGVAKPCDFLRGDEG